MRTIISPESGTWEPSSGHTSPSLVLRRFYLPMNFFKVVPNKTGECPPGTFLSERNSEPSFKVSEKRMETVEYNGPGLSQPDSSTNRELRDIFLLHRQVGLGIARSVHEE